MLLPAGVAALEWGWPVGLTVLGAEYLIACWLWPWTRCWRCKGTGKFRSPTGRAWRDCPRCDGRGKRLRIGRYIVALLQGATDDD